MLREDLAWLFYRLQKGLVAGEVSALARHGLSLRAYMVLVEVVDAPGRPQLALGEAVSIDKTKMVGVLDELEAAGLVTRTPDPADRRARLVEPTAAGHAVLGAARADIRTLEDRLLADLAPDDRAAFRAVLSQLVGEPLARLEGNGGRRGA